MKIIIFAGGVGTRLWPLSRKNTPKQFEKIIGDKSTLQQTVDRLYPEFQPEDIFIATGKRYEATIRAQLPQIPQENFIFEPEMRDVGPAIGLTTFILEKRFPNEPMAILWSDHMVKNIQAFKSALLLAEKTVKEQKSNFVFIAQKARFANQNMGWIEVGETIGQEGMEDSGGVGLYKFKSFHYRPKLEEAQSFFADPHYVWNLGYFVTTPPHVVSLFKEFAPDMYEKLTSIRDAYDTPEYEQVLSEVYPTFEKISFDDAILVKMEPDNIMVISADLGWSDVGAWESLKEALSETRDENVTRGKVMVENCRDALVFNYTNQLIVGIDLEEVLLINTQDVLLVCPKTSVPKIKKLVESLAGTTHEHLT